MILVSSRYCLNLPENGAWALCVEDTLAGQSDLYRIARLVCSVGGTTVELVEGPPPVIKQMLRRMSREVWADSKIDIPGLYQEALEALEEEGRQEKSGESTALLKEEKSKC